MTHQLHPLFSKTIGNTDVEHSLSCIILPVFEYHLLDNRPETTFSHILMFDIDAERMALGLGQ